MSGFTGWYNAVKGINAVLNGFKDIFYFADSEQVAGFFFRKMGDYPAENLGDLFFGVRTANPETVKGH